MSNSQMCLQQKITVFDANHNKDMLYLFDVTMTIRGRCLQSLWHCDISFFFLLIKSIMNKRSDPQNINLGWHLKNHTNQQ